MLGIVVRSEESQEVVHIAKKCVRRIKVTRFGLGALLLQDACVGIILALNPVHNGVFLGSVLQHQAHLFKLPIRVVHLVSVHTHTVRKQTHTSGTNYNVYIVSHIGRGLTHRKRPTS